MFERALVSSCFLLLVACGDGNATDTSRQSAASLASADAAQEGTADSGGTNGDAGDAGSTCRERNGRAKAALARFAAEADKSCTTNSDCILASLRMDCAVVCSRHALSMKGQATFSENVSAANEAICDGSHNVTCPGIGITPCPAVTGVVCSEGQCKPL